MEEESGTAELRWRKPPARKIAETERLETTLCILQSFIDVLFVERGRLEIGGFRVSVGFQKTGVHGRFSMSEWAEGGTVGGLFVISKK